MTRSATSTDRPAAEVDSGFRPWHFYVLLSMAGATVAVMLAQETHPAALLLISAAVVAAGFVGVAFHHALSGFLGLTASVPEPLDETAREALEREKLLTLRAIKELEFDKAMRKVSDADYADMSARLRTRALSLMEELERTPDPVKAAAPARRAGVCAACGTANDADARFCKSCGGRLGGSPA
jgi:hypothetical protein